MSELCNAQNIGKVLEKQLLETGIETIEQLKETGSKQAWLNIKATDHSS